MKIKAHVRAGYVLMFLIFLYISLSKRVLDVYLHKKQCSNYKSNPWKNGKSDRTIKGKEKYLIPPPETATIRFAGCLSLLSLHSFTWSPNSVLAQQCWLPCPLAVRLSARVVGAIGAHRPAGIPGLGLEQLRQGAGHTALTLKGFLRPLS